ncbi:O-antigen translocase [Winogradskyella sp. UBA3174]|uniref:O-antigen translocase n=1 Tax=Winogradskyella sp. UBA3174 TaxID=1947785 RepID=UPI0025F002C1|nr:O-antigen translocase [Winogradskyella sp. UBA3174]
MKLPKFLSGNIVLKITSLNAAVISVRLVVSFFVQKLLAAMVGDAGYALVGQIRNLTAMLTSTSTLGVFNGAVKYVSEFRDNKSELQKIFSTISVFILIGSFISGAILYFFAEPLSVSLFKDESYDYVLKILALIIPFIAVNRVFSGVINGLSDYKSYAKVELVSYLLSTAILLYGLFNFNLDGVLVALAIAPLIQLIILLVVFGKRLVLYVQPSKLKFSLIYKNQLLAFTIMSFVSTFLLNYIEIELRNLISNEISLGEAGNWTAVMFISKNYMVFASGLFSLYVIPKFASIHNKKDFKTEVLNIYKTILPIFALGMLVVYLVRNYIIQFVYPEFTGMEPLFKWQLLGDFIRLLALVLAHQFLAKRLVKSFVITEIISLVLFFVLSQVFIQYYGTEGVVIAHFVRYIIYFIIVVFVVRAYYSNTDDSKA